MIRRATSRRSRGGQQRHRVRGQSGQPAVDAADFVKRSQADSQPVAVGSSGIGSIPHLTLEMFADASRAKVMHVPYKGAAPVINDVMGNRWRASSATCRA